MATTSESVTSWTGNLLEGSGLTQLGSSRDALPVNWTARAAGEGEASTPEEFLAAAHSSCFSMALAHALGGAGYEPRSIRTSAVVTFEAGRGVTGSHLSVNADVPGVSADAFAKIAAEAKDGCPISVALAGTTITIAATLG